MSFHAGRTTGAAVPPTRACNWLSTIGNSLGACSVSTRIQSKPAPAIASAVTLLHELHHRPICGRASRMAFLKVLTGISISKVCASLRHSASLYDLSMSRCKPRQSFDALALETCRLKAPEDWRSPRRYHESRKFMVPMHAEFGVRTLHEPERAAGILPAEEPEKSAADEVSV